MMFAPLLISILHSHSAAIQAPKGYKLVWADEFGKAGRPDPKNWTFETGFERNRELQWYQPENAWVEHGRLVIEGRREKRPNPNYDPTSNDWRKTRPNIEFTSACVKSMGLQQFQYGRLEVRAKFSAKAGLWPAIWTLGVDHPWPSCGEVDVLEYYQDTILANTVHGTGSGIWNSAKIPYADFAQREPNWDSKFHVWAMDWDENSIKLYLDGHLLNQTDTTKAAGSDGFNPFRQPHYILLNLALGSNGGDPSKTEFPSRYEIDYVRVYQRK